MSSHEKERPTRGELIDAERTIKILEQRSRLRPVEQKKLDGAREVIEKERLFVAQAAEATLREKPNQNMKNALISTSEGNEDPERALDALIERVETRFLEWGEEMIPKIREHVPEGELRDTLEFPFAAVQRNRVNPLRNILALRRKVDEMRSGESLSVKSWGHPFYVNCEGYTANFALDNLNFFFYESREQNRTSVLSEPNVVAGYHNALRTLQLGRINPDNVTDLIFFFHEIEHLGQDTAIRLRIVNQEGWNAYNGLFRNDAETPILNWEAQTYGCEIELLNILLEGDLKKNPAAMTMDHIRRSIQIPQHYIKGIESLLHLSKYYYPQGMSQGTFSTLYSQAISQVCEWNQCYILRQEAFRMIPCGAIQKEHEIEIPRVEAAPSGF